MASNTLVIGAGTVVKVEDTDELYQVMSDFYLTYNMGYSEGSIDLGKLTRYLGELDADPYYDLRSGDWYYDTTNAVYKFYGNSAWTSFSVSTHGHNGTYCRWRGASATEPSDNIAGDIWIDTSGTATPKIYSGSAWISLI